MTDDIQTCRKCGKVLTTDNDLACGECSYGDCEHLHDLPPQIQESITNGN